ncbi:uncharacterized protein PADG_05499 [Paracoccidioides brasiliensis Pb18]|uniref:Uncharacterized protein n=1 Tax=Paracoccidioides brasiliensis (strain Pb18) TaxID=502780 RepID=C1GE13_PARBD|nr:uncharacterized protein PADG_05499 [Paracoccidioides brasiliensis Pb18]EEH49420.2 hypothetical protein PADG_05499 [Paracoccidioides brasiliensis Pb18]
MMKLQDFYHFGVFIVLIWGGHLTFVPDKTNQVLAAVRDFTEYYPDDKAAIIASHGIIPGNRHGEYLVDIAVEATTLSPAPTTLRPCKQSTTALESIVTENKLVPGLQTFLTCQPIPKRLARHARKNGGGLRDHDDSVDRIFMVMNNAYNLTSDIPRTEGDNDIPR